MGKYSIEKVSALPEGANRKLLSLERRLHLAYGAPEAALGNKHNPLNEAIYILLSYQTNIRRSRRTWSLLRSLFPRWNDVEKARVVHIARVLRQGGLHRQKARVIKALLRRVRRMFGSLSLERLKCEPDIHAERILLSLPGLSWKGARCVLLYSLNRSFFPVDVNTFRIFKRVGIIRADSVFRRKTLHDALQAAVPSSRRKRFHINLVIHGQRTCLPLHPNCQACSVLSICPRIGL
jgi:endonuclease III